MVRSGYDVGLGFPKTQSIVGCVHSCQGLIACLSTVVWQLSVATLVVEVQVLAYLTRSQFNQCPHPACNSQEQRQKVQFK